MANLIAGLMDRMSGANKRIAVAEAKAAKTFTVQDFLNGVPMPSGAGIAEAYHKSWIAYSCIDRKATDMAGIPLVVQRTPDDPEDLLPDSHPLVQLIKYPSPDFSQSEFLKWIAIWSQLRGEFFLTFDNAMAPKEIIFWRDPQYFREQLSGGRVTGWEYRQGNDAAKFTKIDVLHHRLPNPANPWRGQSPLQAAARNYGIDVSADTLQEDVINRGGERSVMYRAPADTTKEQREQALAQLRGRRNGDGTTAKDVILPAGMDVINPQFIENDMSILESQKIQPDKICAVYGLSKSLLGMEDIDKYATFEGRLRVYFTQTLIPLMHGIESTFDRYIMRNMTSRWHGYVRFDLTKVPALSDSLDAKFQTAALAHAAGLPWTVCNERFNLGLDIDNVPAADQVFVSAGMVPVEQLLQEWANPAPEAPAPDPMADPAADPTDDHSEPDPEPDGPDDETPTPAKGLTQALVTKRAGDVRANVQRQVRLLKAEKALRSDWKKLVSGYSRKAQAAVSGAASPIVAREALTKAMAGFGNKAVEVVGKYHRQAATEGARSIVEIVHGKMADRELEVWKARAPWRPQVAEFIQQRQNLVKGMADDLFEDVTSAAASAVVDGVEGDALVSLVASRFDSGPGGLNRAVTIARTEIGSAYSVARNAEMTGQGFEKHMWQTAGDEAVRDGSEPGESDHAKCDGEVVNIGEKFSCGLEFPMAPGGEAANVINCRCETIPLVPGME